MPRRNSRPLPFVVRSAYGGGNAQLPCHFEGKDHASRRGSDDHFDSLILEAVGDEPADLGGCSWLPQQIELFDVLVTVTARREDEVTLLEGTGSAQYLDDAAFRLPRGRLSADKVE